MQALHIWFGLMSARGFGLIRGHTGYFCAAAGFISQFKRSVFSAAGAWHGLVAEWFRPGFIQKSRPFRGRLLA